MSGDVQPRKRKDKRRKKDISNTQPEYTAQKIRGVVEETVEDVDSNFSSDENIHVHKDDGTGGNVAAKIVFFVLLGVLGVMIVLIIAEYRGSSDLDASVPDSPWAVVFDGWVDESPSKHDEPAEVEESEEHEASHEEGHSEDDHDEHDEQDEHEHEHDEPDEHDEQEESQEPASGEDQEAVSEEDQEALSGEDEEPVSGEDEEAVSGEDQDGQSQEDEPEEESQPEESEEVGEGGEEEEEEEEEEDQEEEEQEASEEELNDIPGVTESTEDNDGDEAEDQSQGEEEEADDTVGESAEADSKEDELGVGEADESPEDIQKTPHSPIHSHAAKDDTKKGPVLASEVPKRTVNDVSDKKAENIASEKIHKVPSPEPKSEPQIQKTVHTYTERSVASDSKKLSSGQDVPVSESVLNSQTEHENLPTTTPTVESTKTFKIPDRIAPHNIPTQPVHSPKIEKDRKPPLPSKEVLPESVKVHQNASPSISSSGKQSVQSPKVTEPSEASKPEVTMSKTAQPIEASRNKDTPKITVSNIAQPGEISQSKDRSENLVPKTARSGEIDRSKNVPKIIEPIEESRGEIKPEVAQPVEASRRKDKPDVIVPKVPQSVEASRNKDEPEVIVPKVPQSVEASRNKDKPEVIPKVAKPLETARSKDKPEVIQTEAAQPVETISSKEKFENTIPKVAQLDEASRSKDKPEVKIQKTVQKVNLSPSQEQKELYSGSTESPHTVKSGTVKVQNVKPSSAVHLSAAKNVVSKPLPESEKQGDSNSGVDKLIEKEQLSTIEPVPKTSNIIDTLESVNSKVPNMTEQTHSVPSNSIRLPGLEKEKIAEVESILHQDNSQIPVTVSADKSTTLVGGAPQMKDSSKSPTHPKSSQHGMGEDEPEEGTEDDVEGSEGPEGVAGEEEGDEEEPEPTGATPPPPPIKKPADLKLSHDPADDQTPDESEGEESEDENPSVTPAKSSKASGEQAQDYMKADVTNDDDWIIQNELDLAEAELEEDLGN